MRTRRAPTAAVYSPSDFSFWSDGIWDQDRLVDAYGRTAGPARSVARKRAMDVARQTVYVNHALKPLAGHDPPPTPVAYPDSGTGQALRNLARMLGAGLGIRVATVQADGAFDSHENQLGSHGRDLADVGDALLAFQRDLEARGLAGRVLTLVWSEFGRRVEDNASNGTDHGAGSLVLAVARPRARPSRTAGTSPTPAATAETCRWRSTSATSTRASSTGTSAATCSAACRGTAARRSRSWPDATVPAPRGR